MPMLSADPSFKLLAICSCVLVLESLVLAGIDESTTDLGRLVGGEATGDTEDDAAPGEHGGTTDQTAVSSASSASTTSSG